MRFLFEKNVFPIHKHKPYGWVLVYDVVVYFDGLSFFVLLYYHLKNFRTHIVANENIASSINGDNITDEVIRGS